MNTEYISVHQITVTSLLDRSLESAFPELYGLDSVIERQDWHDGQSVFDHSIKTALGLDSIIVFDFLDSPAKRAITEHLQKKVDSHTKLELLKLAAIFHDIGKAVTIYHKPGGDTSCPSHAAVGSVEVTPILSRIELSDEERVYIKKLISDHLLPSDLIEIGISNAASASQILQLIQKNCLDITVESVLLSYADWLGCEIRANVKVELHKRMSIAQQCLSELSGSKTDE